MLREAVHRKERIDDYVAQMIDRFKQRLAGQRVLMVGGLRKLDMIAREGIDAWFAGKSIYFTLGGLMDHANDPHLEDRVVQFWGAILPMDGYRMTEFLGGLSAADLAAFVSHPAL